MKFSRRNLGCWGSTTTRGIDAPEFSSFSLFLSDDNVGSVALLSTLSHNALS